MTISMKVNVLPEPYLEFGDGGQFCEPKTGLIASGPFSLRYGNDFPGSVRLGFIGTAQLLEAGHRWFERCQQGILAGKSNRQRHPDFPPFEEVFRTKLDIQNRWSLELSQKQLASALSRPPNQQFNALVDLYDDGVKQLSEREVGPNIVVCSLPDELLKKFHTWQPSGRPRKLRSTNPNPLQQPMLFDEQSSASNPEDTESLIHDFRRSLKARAMKHDAHIQLAHNKLFLDREGGDDPATKAWDVCTGCFYKAGGIPWRLAQTAPYTCFVGISFHRLRTQATQSIYSSCAEAFSTDTEGFVLRGDFIDWPRNAGRAPHLNESQAFKLAQAIVSEYRNRAGRNPIRLVVHKTSKFEEPEKSGFKAAWNEIPQIEFITLYNSELRLLPRGDYPPRRGTLQDVNGSQHLYTTGFYEPWGSYPGPHIPRPIDVRDESDMRQTERACREILGLTKMSFNSAAPFSARPITTKMAVEVGRIMAAIEEGRTPEPSYRNYM